MISLTLPISFASDGVKTLADEILANLPQMLLSHGS